MVNTMQVVAPIELRKEMRVKISNKLQQVARKSDCNIIADAINIETIAFFLSSSVDDYYEVIARQLYDYICRNAANSKELLGSEVPSQCKKRKRSPTEETPKRQPKQWDPLTNISQAITRWDCANTPFIFQQLPTEIIYAIFEWLSLQDLLVLSLVNRWFYEMAGNEPRWKQLCDEMELKNIPETWRPIHTAKNAFAISKLCERKNKCYLCGARTSIHLAVWNAVLCKICRTRVTLTKGQAKELYLLKDSDLNELRYHLVNNYLGGKSFLYLHHEVEAVAVKKWGNLRTLQMELEKRVNNRQKREMKKKEEREIDEELSDAFKCISSDEDMDETNERKNCRFKQNHHSATTL